jgi:DNA-binding LacI/PurR family transcriptional regulator
MVRWRSSHGNVTMPRDPLPTAIFAVNNMTAVGAMEALRERRLVLQTNLIVRTSCCVGSGVPVR